MHTTPDAADYEWPSCTNPRCGRALWPEEAHRQVCRPCEQTAHDQLGELPALFVRLSTTAALLRRVGNRGVGSSSSDAPPIPGRLEVMDLTGPGGAADRLRTIEDTWRRALGRQSAARAGSPTAAVPIHVTFLRINLQRACDTHEGVAQDLDAIRRLHRECTAAVSSGPRPARVGIGICPTRDAEGSPCGEPLAASSAHHRVHCPRCGARWDGMADWRDLRRAQDDVAAATAILDADHPEPEPADEALAKVAVDAAAEDKDEADELPVYAYSGGGWTQR
ncbi:hypothetical protein ACFXHD_13830 [Streptomyces hydrogenans]|uniref:hypothetical protein n=1 Tax=Streptomyces hydrogenans TaxID=1873719 RepID=UPI00368E33D7